MSRFIDITGQKYNKLTVLSFHDIVNKKARWLCRCECGNEKILYAKDVKNGNTKSCGCLLHQKKYDEETRKKITRLQHIYYHIKQRCYDKNRVAYKYYGERGIKMCDEWLENTHNFINWAFENGYKDELTIERINVNGDYEPNNCKWITLREQGYNKTNSRLYTINGETKCLSQWCNYYHIDYFVVRGRLRRGAPIIEALTKPIDKTKRNKLYKRKDDEI